MAVSPNSLAISVRASWSRRYLTTPRRKKGIFIFAPTVGFTKKEPKAEENGNGKKNGKGKDP